MALERKMTSYKNEQVMLSWTGTMFEYLMPVLWMKIFPNTIMDETTRGAVRATTEIRRRKVDSVGNLGSVVLDDQRGGTLSLRSVRRARDRGEPRPVARLGRVAVLDVPELAGRSEGRRFKNIHRMKDLGFLGLAWLLSNRWTTRSRACRRARSLKSAAAGWRTTRA